MNLVSAERMDAVARAHGFVSAAPDVAAKFDALVLRIVKAALDAAGAVACQCSRVKGVKGVHFDALCRVARLIGEPISKKGQRGGNDPGLPLRYFGDPETDAYSETIHDPIHDPSLARPASVADSVFFSGGQTGGGGDPVLPPAFFGRPDAAYTPDPGHSMEVGPGLARDGMVSSSVFEAHSLAGLPGIPGIPPGMSGGGSHGPSSRFKFEAGAFDRACEECCARYSIKLVDKDAKRKLRTIVEANCDALVGYVRSSSAKGTGKRMTSAALAKCAAEWCVVY